MEFILESIKCWVVNTRNGASSSTLLYWLVYNPKILNFSWDKGQTPGSSPLFLTIVVLSYLLIIFLLSRITLPSIRPSILRALAAMHDLFLLTLSYTMALGCILSVILHAPNMRYMYCYPVNTAPKGPHIFWTYIFYLSKIYELLDTFIIILRNSIKQLTFLHVYHHSLAVVGCYASLHTSQSFFACLLPWNCVVHVVMYSYYFLCSIGIRPTWKRFVTTVQIWQFFLSLFVMVGWIFYYYFTGSQCSGIWGWWFDLVFILTLLVLFLDFYSNKYSKNNEAKKDT